MSNSPPYGKDAYISAISRAGDAYGNKLLQFLDRFGLYGLIDATEVQLQQFTSEENIKVTEDGEKWTF